MNNSKNKSSNSSNLNMSNITNKNSMNNNNNNSNGRQQAKSYSTVVKSSENRVPKSPSSSSPNSRGAMSDDDRKINLNALKNQDPFATNILDTAQRVAVYKFLAKKNEWKKLDVEGSLFLFERVVEPLHSFVVMNTLALNLFLQPVTYDLEFQDRNPFLLYKSNNGECQPASLD
jgi:hypothetical protein